MLTMVIDLTSRNKISYRLLCIAENKTTGVSSIEV